MEQHQNPSTDKDLLRINVENVERHIIISILTRTNGNQREAAKLLGTTRRRLQYRVLKYHIDVSQFRPSHESQTPVLPNRLDSGGL